MTTPPLVVRPFDPDTELNYILATSADALIETRGGKFARRETFRQLVRELVARSPEINVVTFADDPEVILGFAVWGADRSLEIVHLRLSLAKKSNGRWEPLELAKPVAKELLGPDRLLRMRRIPPQGWAWRVINTLGYVPSISPEAI